MAGNGRPLTNRSNYWHEQGLGILEAAAVKVLHRFEPSVRTHFVEKDELVCAGWLRSFRYADDKKLKFQYLHAITHMQACYFRLLRERSGSKYQIKKSPLPERLDDVQGRCPEGEPYICPYSGLGFLAVDIVDELIVAEEKP